MKKYYDEKNMHELYGRKVRIYFNLHKKVWSIKDKKTNLVLGWTNKIRLINCEFKVYESGRQRVLKDRKKNVHAYVDGTIASNFYMSIRQYACAHFTYNPYKYDSFMVKDIVDRFKHREIEEPVYNAEIVHMWTENNRPKQLLFNEVR